MSKFQKTSLPKVPLKSSIYGLKSSNVQVNKYIYNINIYIIILYNIVISIVLEILLRTKKRFHKWKSDKIEKEKCTGKKVRNSKKVNFNFFS